MIVFGWLQFEHVAPSMTEDSLGFVLTDKLMVAFVIAYHIQYLDKYYNSEKRQWSLDRAMRLDRLKIFIITWVAAK